MISFEEYNFDSTNMINSFNFEDFIKRAKECKVYKAGVLIITDNQYILSYTRDYGDGDHFPAFARLFKDINGGGFLSTRKAQKIHSEGMKKYITAKIYFGYDSNNDGIILFENLKNLNTNNYKLFVEFYNNYNEIIKTICNSTNFCIGYYDNNNNNLITSKNFDNLLSYIQTIEKKSNINDKNKESILGVSLENNNKEKHY